MAESKSLIDPRPAPVAGGRWMVAAALVVGIAARAAIHFGTSLEPRINGPYYPVQARSLLETGHLAVPDLPLLFYVHAGLAAVLRALTGWDTSRAVLLACKIADSVAPALLVVPVYFLLQRWPRAGASRLVVAAVLALAAVHPSLLSMTSEFEKNALGLVWFAAFAVALRDALAGRSRASRWWVVFFAALGAFTHIGVLGAMLTFAALAVAGSVAWLDRRKRWLLAVALLAGAAGLLAIFVVGRYFDPKRAERLVSLIRSPSELVSGGGQPFPGPPPGFGPGGPGGPSGHGGSAGPVGPPPFGGPPGMMGPGNLTIVPMVLTHLAALSALLILWLRRREVDRADRVVVAALAVTALFLASPLIGGDRAPRFQLMSALPFILLVPFVLTHWRSRAGVTVVAAGLLVVAPVSLWFSLHANVQPTIPADSYAELQSLGAHVSAPEKTLIIARHGLEWWVLWTLRTKVAHANTVTATDWQKYELVAALKQKRGGPGGPGGRNGPNGPGGGPPGAWMHSRGPLSGRGFPGGPPPGYGPPGGFAEFPIPRGAPVLADGAVFTLVRIPEAPRDRFPGL